MNTTAKHTPGPWTIDPVPSLDDGEVGRVFIYPAAQEIYGDDRKDIADVLPWYGEGTRDANAALIARAPDLLEVAKDYAAYLQGKRRELGSAEISHLGAIELLIAKAEGRL